MPLADTAIEIIRTMPPMLGRDTVFGGRGDGFTDWTRSKHALDAKLGDAVGEWRLHDLRRSAATEMCDLGVAPHIVEQILKHAGGHKAGVAGTYNRSSYESENPPRSRTMGRACRRDRRPAAVDNRKGG